MYEKSPNLNEQMKTDQTHVSHREEHPKLNLLAVYDDVNQGAVNELIHHPLHVAEEAAIGVGVAIGFSLLAPEVAFAAGAGLTALAVYNFYEHSKGWWHAGRLVSGSEKSTPTDMKAAHKELQKLGADSLDLAAASFGGLTVVRAGIGRVGLNIKPEPPAPPRLVGGLPEDWKLEFPDLTKKNPDSNLPSLEPTPHGPRFPKDPVGGLTKDSRSAYVRHGAPLSGPRIPGPSRSPKDPTNEPELPKSKVEPRLNSGKMLTVDAPPDAPSKPKVSDTRINPSDLDIYRGIANKSGPLAARHPRVAGAANLGKSSAGIAKPLAAGSRETPTGVTGGDAQAPDSAARETRFEVQPTQQSKFEQQAAHDALGYGRIPTVDLKLLDPERLAKVIQYSRLADELYPNMPEGVKHAAYRYLMHFNKVDDYTGSIERDEATLENFRIGALKRLRILSDALTDDAK